MSRLLWFSSRWRTHAGVRVCPASHLPLRRCSRFPQLTDGAKRPREESENRPFGRGITLFLGRSQSDVCPVAALLNYLAIRPSAEGALFVHSNGAPLLKRQFVAGVRKALSLFGLDSSTYSGHSFRIGVATSAAAAGIPDHLIKTLGHWESSAYQLYIRTPCQSLTSVSHLLMRQPQGQCLD